MYFRTYRAVCFTATGCRFTPSRVKNSTGTLQVILPLYGKLGSCHTIYSYMNTLNQSIIKSVRFTNQNSSNERVFPISVTFHITEDKAHVSTFPHLYCLRCGWPPPFSFWLRCNSGPIATTWVIAAVTPEGLTRRKRGVGRVVERLGTLGFRLFRH